MAPEPCTDMYQAKEREMGKKRKKKRETKKEEESASKIRVKSTTFGIFKTKVIELKATMTRFVISLKARVLRTRATTTEPHNTAVNDE
jgi:hypothetical protein